MIIKQGNMVSYGIKYLLFDTLQDFSVYTGAAEPGSKAYIIENSKTYILDETNQWHIYESPDMFRLRGTLSSAAQLEALTNYKSGDAYKATDSFYVAGLGQIESGEIVLATADNDEFDVGDWVVLQSDLDVFVGATSQTNGSQGVVPQPLAGAQAKFLSANGSWRDVTTDLLSSGSEEVIFDCN